MNMQIIFTADTPDGCAALAPVILAATEAFKVLEASRATAAQPAPDVAPGKAKGPAKAAAKPAAVETVAETPAPVEATLEGPAEAPATESENAPIDAGERVTLEALRLKLKEVVIHNREGVLAALAAHDAANLAGLDEAKYASFHQALLAL